MFLVVDHNVVSLLVFEPLTISLRGMGLSSAWQDHCLPLEYPSYAADETYTPSRARR